MSKSFKIHDRASRNSEARRVSGTIARVHFRNFSIQGYTHHASTDAPRYEIKSAKTEHITHARSIRSAIGHVSHWTQSCDCGGMNSPNERKCLRLPCLFVLLCLDGEPSWISRIHRLHQKEGLTVRKRCARGSC